MGSVSVRPDALYELVLGLGLGGGGGAQRPLARAEPALEQPWTTSGEAPRLGLGSLQREKTQMRSSEHQYQRWRSCANGFRGAGWA